MTDEDALSFINETWRDDVIPRLKEYIRIPNKSPMFDPEWAVHGHMDRAVELLAAWVKTRTIKGITSEVISLPGRTPVLFCEVEPFSPLDERSSSSIEQSVLLYGHYDKQPEFDGWHPDLAPWEPVERDGKLYGRGGADDGYALFASLLAIETLQRRGLAHPRCVILIEGCEESGSYDLPHYVDALRSRIGDARLVICLDAECGNYDQLWITTSLRGMLPGVLRVDILEQGQHSGTSAFLVQNSSRSPRPH